MYPKALSMTDMKERLIALTSLEEIGDYTTILTKNNIQL